MNLSMTNKRPFVLVIIQARTSSTRLPNKVFLNLEGKPLLYRMVERVQAAKLVDKIVIATSTERNDDAIIGLCKRIGIDYFRGSLNDLLSRHYYAAVKFGGDVIVKIPSDCPLIDPKIIDKVIGYFLENYGKYDYVSNLHPQSYPDGNDVEVFTFEALQKAFREATQDFEREHTTPYFWENPDIFRIGNVEWETGLNLSMEYRFTIDYNEDYRFIKAVYSELYLKNKYFSLEDILKLLEEKEEIAKINKKYCGVNWYRHHLDKLKTIKSNETVMLIEENL